MKKSLSRILVVILAVMLLLPTTAMASDATQSGETKPGQNLETIAAEKASLLTQAYGTISVQYALIDQGEILLSGQSGMNDMAGEIPLTNETMYGIGSTSKVFTTAAVLKLADQGRIDLDTPLVEYIPDFKMKDERYKLITPRMLLNHSSGLHGSTLINAFLFADSDPYAKESLLQHLANQTLKADPGAFSVYSNDSFTLAEILVERVSGTDYTAFIHQHFTGPLNMNNTKTSQDALDPDQLAGLYYPTYQGQLPNETVNVIGTGGIYSTAEDLARFATIFTGETEGILSPQAIQAMEQEEYKNGIWPEDADNSIDFGLGWDSVRLYPFNDYGIKALTKGGDTILCHASLVVLPEHNMAASVLSSGGSSSFNQLLASELLLQALKEKGVIDEFKPAKSFGVPVAADMPEEMKEYAGYYVATNVQMHADIRDGKLFLTVPMSPEEPAQTFVYTGDGDFVSEEGSTKVRFVTESNDRTYMWVKQYATLPELGQMALNQYQAEKVEKETLPGRSEAAWKKREGKSYYLLNEKYTSIAYMIMKPVLTISRVGDMPAYIADRKIVGPDLAVSQHQVPGTGSRDTSDISFFTQQGVEYAEAAGSLYMSEDGIKPLYHGKKSRLTIHPEGHARWFTVPEQAAARTMTVELPENGGFAVYDENGVCLNFTVISGEASVALPENGTVVFAGDPGSVFQISLD
ncbi:serine hydrolase domain-containing protein [Paenibacillus cisolokensis]|uniref:serine hydrolase domain-containing protein n=1 Tax=Paenibacillus cisolokensis TaxID=1658519 RepID=UPI003D27F4D7